MRSRQVLVNGGDLFVATASELFSVPPAGVTPEQRQHAKRVVYGILYGIGPRQLSEDLGVSLAAAGALLDAFRRRFRGLSQFTEGVKATCRQQGSVGGLLGVGGGGG